MNTESLPSLPTPDVKVTHHGSIMLLEPVNETAREWLQEHTERGALWYGGALVVEPRYFDALAEGANDAGLVLANA